MIRRGRAALFVFLAACGSLPAACGSRSMLYAVGAGTTANPGGDGSVPPDHDVADAAELPDAPAAPDVSEPADTYAPADQQADAPVVPPPCEGGLCSISLASGPGWEAYAGNVSTVDPSSYTITADLGRATDVCLIATSPPGCPTGSLLWNFGPASGGPTWTGGDGLTDAWWIWRPDVTADSPAAFAVAIFQEQVAVGLAAQGTLRISADDWAAVFIDGVLVGSIGSLSDLNAAASAHSVATRFDLGPYLAAGVNTITVAAANGPFNCPGDMCPYSQDPAGVIFDGTITW